MNIININAINLKSCGYIPDGYSSKDLLFSKLFPLTGNQNSNIISIKQYFKEISNQYSLSSCVANATADAFESQIARKNNIDPSKVDDLSRLFIYWNARNLNNASTITDNGSKIRLAFDSMARYGIPKESTWLYDQSKVNARPSIIAYREAIQHRIYAFYRIDGTNDARIEQIKQALSCGCPVVFGTPIADSFRYVKDNSIISYPSDPIIGRHAMVIVSWDEGKRAFEIRNSWGTTWGTQGYGWMSADYITNSQTTDLWVPTI